MRITDIDKIEDGRLYLVVLYTDSTPIVVRVDIEKDCCEILGIYDNYDDIRSSHSFVGAEVIGVSMEHGYVRDDECGYATIRVITDRFEYELKITNEHNGYYSHSVLLNSVYHTECVYI